MQGAPVTLDDRTLIRARPPRTCRDPPLITQVRGPHQTHLSPPFSDGWPESAQSSAPQHGARGARLSRPPLPGFGTPTLFATPDRAAGQNGWGARMGNVMSSRQRPSTANNQPTDQPADRPTGSVVGHRCWTANRCSAGKAREKRRPETGSAAAAGSESMVDDAVVVAPPEGDNLANVAYFISQSAAATQRAGFFLPFLTTRASCRIGGVSQATRGSCQCATGVLPFSPFGGRPVRKGSREHGLRPWGIGTSFSRSRPPPPNLPWAAASSDGANAGPSHALPRNLEMQERDAESGTHGAVCCIQCAGQYGIRLHTWHPWHQQGRGLCVYGWGSRLCTE
jgi:hypothetical protein